MKSNNNYIIVVSIILLALLGFMIYNSTNQNSFENSFTGDATVQQYLDDRGLVEQDTTTPKVIFGAGILIVFGMLVWTTRDVKNGK